MEAQTKVLERIRKSHGAGAVFSLDDETLVKNIDVIPTGSSAIDRIIGIGGWPRGRIVELIGPESVGKSTLCLHAVASAHRLGLHSAFVDAEHALDPGYAESLGVDKRRLYLSQPDSGEQALSIVEEWIREPTVGIVVIDSVAALVPQSELDGEMGSHPMASQARLMGQGMRKLCPIAAKSNTLLLFTNQLRDRIGGGWGAAETTPGGRALKFYASLRIDLRRVQTIKEADRPIGVRSRAKVLKNKLATPFEECQFSVMYGKGIVEAVDVFDRCVDVGIIEKRGLSYFFDDLKIGKSKATARQEVETNQELRVILEERLEGVQG